MISIGLISFLIAVPLYSSHITHTQFSRITSFLLIYSSILSFNGYYLEYISEGISIYNNLFQISTVSVGIDILLFVIGTMLLFSWGPLSNNVSKTEYSLIVIFTIMGASLLISSTDIVSMFLSIELQSFAVYVLATLYRNSESSTAAGLKYFLLGGLSSAIILLGTSLIYYNTGLTNLESIYSLISVDTTNQPILFFGAVLITIGFLFKVASAPFHNWAPDVYDGTPTIVTAWISTMPKISIFIFILSFSTVVFSTHSAFSGGDIGKNVILLASLLSLLLGTILGLSQYKIKRLLTYSTISHVGFLLLALVINSEESIESFIFYLIQYSITNVNVFIILLGIGYLGISENRDVSLITELRGMFTKNPLLSLGFAICLFSIAGIPPLVGFFAKQIVLYSSMHQGFYFISIVAIIVSVISASYYLKIVQVIYFNSDNTNAPNRAYKIWGFERISTGHSTIISILTITITLFMFIPQISSTLLNSCHLLALSMFYY